MTRSDKLRSRQMAKVGTPVLALTLIWLAGCSSQAAKMDEAGTRACEMLAAYASSPSSDAEANYNTIQVIRSWIEASSFGPFLDLTSSPDGFPIERAAEYCG